jgi:CheY-like chemotaxis protein
MKKILVVDDDVVVQKLLSQILEREGYQIISAKDGIDAMLLVRKERPDLVVLDIMMPHLNGYDVCRTIKVDPDLKTIPIILLTSREQEIDKRVLDLMGIEYLQKTCRPQDLVARIQKILCQILLAFFLFTLPSPVFAAPLTAGAAKTPFQQYNPDIDKFAFSKSFIASLSYYGRLNARLVREQETGDKFDQDLNVLKTFIDNRTLDNIELRIAKNYLSKYAQSRNLFIRKVAYDAMLAYEQNITVSSAERRLWEAYYRFKKMGVPKDLNEGDFKDQMARLARDRKVARMAVLEAVMMFKKVLLSAKSCEDEHCENLALTPAQRDKLIEKLDDFAGDNMAWGIKDGQGTFEAAIASVREVLEDPAYVSVP